MKRKIKKIVFLLILVLICIVIFNAIDKSSIVKKQINAVIGTFYTEDEQNLQTQEIEKQIKAVMETVYRYESQGTQLQYDTYRKNLSSSPEDATSQHPVYTVCSGLVYQSYYQALGIMLPDDTTKLLDYAKDNKANKDVVLAYYGSKDEMYTENVIGIKNSPNYAELAKEWSKFLKPGDIFVITGHAMLIESVDVANSKVTIIETGYGEIGSDEVDRYDCEKHCDVYEANGTIRRMNLEDKLRVCYNKYKNGSSSTPSRMCLIRIITDGTNYIDENNNPATYNGVTPAAQSRLEYPGIDIGKIVYVPDGSELVSQNILTNVGEELIYQVKVKNTSSNTNYGEFDIIENIDSKVSYQGFEIYEKTDSNTQIKEEKLGENQVKWNISSLNAGKWVTIKYKVKVKKDKSLLGQVIQSTGKVDNISTSKIETLIGNKLNEEEKSKLLTSFNNLKNNGKTERDFINEVYKDALNLDMGLTNNLKNLDIMSYDSSVKSGGRADGVLSVKYTRLNETAVKKYVYNNFYGLRIADANDSDKSLVKNKGQWNTKAIYEIKDRARTLTANMLLDGDILLAYTGDTSTTDTNLVNKSYIYLENKLVRKISSSKFEEISGADLKVFLRNIVCDNYVILRPSIQIKRNYAEEECSNAEFHATLEWTDNGDGTHSNICTACDYTSTENHEGANHANNGQCTKCSAIYETHSKSEEIKEYKPTENGHQIIYKCTASNCEETFEATENHEGATHQNNGQCTKCKAIYAPHSKSEKIKEYKPTENGHQIIYKCTASSCEETFEGEEVIHQLGEWTDNEDGTHSAICTDCQHELTENHEGANHSNNGQCTKCRAIYDPHSKSEEIKEYKPTENGHQIIYKCIASNCEETFEGEEVAHQLGEWTDNENGTHSAICTICKYEVTEIHNYGEDGICEKCEARIPTEKCEHTYKIETNGTYHWNFCSKCQVAQEGSLELHKYEEYASKEDGTHSTICAVCKYEVTENHEGATHANNGQCTKCNAIYEIHSQSEEIKEYKLTENGHQIIYKCTNSNCEETFEGAEAAHEVEEWTDKENGTHSAICTVCNSKLTEKHNENCTKCKEIESDSISGSEDNANIDNTVADKEIPKAGIQRMILVLIISVGSLIILIMLKMKKYKDI